jgi:DNA-directed RNA polymerase specialized sigma24 family protein
MVTSSFGISRGFEPGLRRSWSHTARELTRESLDRLLDWLHPDREEAGHAYEKIRRKLIKIFTVRCCDCPEDLADETIDRVIAKVEKIADGYQGDPSLYFYGVARNVFREWSRIKRFSNQSPPQDPADSFQPELDCLDACMERLLPKNRKLLIEYYLEDGKAKIEHRKAIAARHTVEMNALRIRVHRIRSVVSECTTACLRDRSRQRLRTPNSPSGHPGA